jgi:dTMP kinase
MQKGLHICIDGLDGSGKGTAIEGVLRQLSAMGFPLVSSREPGGTEFAEELRGLLLTPRAETIHSETEMLLLLAGRAQHLRNLIEPAISKGAWCIVDRGPISTFSYQCWPDEQKIQFLERANDLLGLRDPDLTLIIDVPVEISEQRRASRGEEADRFEFQARDYFRRVRAGMLEYARRYTDKRAIVVIDGSQSPEKVQADLISAILRFGSGQ